MIFIPGEIAIDNESIITQMNRVNEAQYAFEDELDKLRKLLTKGEVTEKGSSETSPKIRFH
ncbi:MAG: hypothetical protein NC337_09360 [Roseburia sp.]|nr:hypothetical protein [Roseburia sp.]